MNKKFYLGMFAAAGMLLATSCQNDELVDAVQAGNEATVRFNLGVTNGVQTRAISDGESADKLIYAIYNAEKQLITTISGSQNGQFIKEGAFADGLSDNVSITLANGQKYTAIFWAQDADCDAYNTADLTNVTVDYAGVSNDESRDAFFGVQEFTVNGNASIEVKLKRPFAQMNVGVTKDDWDAAVASEITIAKSMAKISEVPNTINLMDGTVTGAQSVEYSLNVIPTEMLVVDADGDGNKEEYVYLSMNYFLADDAKSLVDNVEFTFKPENGAEIVLNQGLNNVPVQRNWRTNILGKFLTGDIDFNIVIVPLYDGENNGLPFDGIIETKEELLAAAKVGGEFTLAEDLTLDESIWVPAGVEFTLNANGKNITYSAVATEPYSIFCAQGPGSNITINADENSVFESIEDTQTPKDGGNMIVWARNGGHITINGGTFIGHTYQGGRCDAIYASYSDNGGWGTITINDGYFMIKETGADAWLLNCRWANGSSWAIQTYGGTFVGYNPALGDEQTGPNSNLPEGYVAEVTGITEDGRNIYTVHSSAIELNGKYYSSISDAIAKAADGEELNIKLAKGSYTIPANAKGKTLSFVGDGNPADIVIKCNENVTDGSLNGSNVTFENLTIESTYANYRGFAHIVSAKYKNCIIKKLYTLYGDSEFDGCTFETEGDNYNVWTYGTNSTFTNCTFNCDGKAVLVYTENNNVDDVVTFNNCVFNDEGGLVDEKKAAIETGANANTVKHTLKIDNCTVKGFAVTEEKTGFGGDNLGTYVWGNKNLITAENLNVFVDGTEVY